MAFKGDLEALILGVLNGTTLHGYEIAKRIRESGGDTLAVGEGRLYPALHKLEAEGKVAGKWEPREGKPPRRIYELTEGGHRELEEQRTAWKSFASGVGSILLAGAPEVTRG
ncbi:MAG TPA: helix-turn-helix transcriptional regulator [Fimbriimonadaceae bacterium]|nr:helix-turn-helix transcriptional regulator [Fimbriimonadaceae bacterium]